MAVAAAWTPQKSQQTFGAYRGFRMSMSMRSFFQSRACTLEASVVPSLRTLVRELGDAAVPRLGPYYYAT